MRGKTLAAVYRTIASRLERNFRFHTTIRTSYGIQLASLTIGSAAHFSLAPARISTFTTTRRFVPEAFLRIKLLFTCCKGEFLLAIPTPQCFVRK
jgi:hypothetical protein